MVGGVFGRSGGAVQNHAVLSEETTSNMHKPITLALWPYLPQRLCRFYPVSCMTAIVGTILQPVRKQSYKILENQLILSTSLMCMCLFVILSM